MKVFHPETFQGNVKKKKYFEGWYYKIISGSEVYAFIPGLALGKDSHAFIQIIDGKTHKTFYLRFPVEEFKCSPGTFNLRIGDNIFTKESISFNENRDSVSLHGEFKFSDMTPFPASPLCPGIMGIFGYIPFMECYHGVVSVDHTVEGELNWNENIIKVKKGRGYIEKDWGRSMPSSWIWIQSNNFQNEGTSFMLSIARIPFAGTYFKGHICYFYHNNVFYKFSTHNLGKYSISEDLKSGNISIRLENRKYFLELFSSCRLTGGELQAPVDGSMNRMIRERTDASVGIRLLKKGGDCIFEDTGESCGIEITGDLKELI